MRVIPFAYRRAAKFSRILKFITKTVESFNMSEFCQISETVHLEISEDVNNFPTADELIR